MNKTTRNRILLSVPIVAAAAVFIFASLPVKDWSVGLGVAMVCAMCLLGLHAIWTRSPALMEEEAEARRQEAKPFSRRQPGDRRARWSIFR